MKRRYLTGLFIFCLLFIMTTESVCQTPSWVVTTGSSGVDEGSDVSTDNQGNVYSCGRFSGTIDFDNGPGVANRTSNGSMDIYVTKYSPSGQFIWAISMGGSGRDGAIALRINSTNEVVVTGYIRNTVDMDPGAGTFNLVGVSNAGVDPGFGGDLFLAKYTSNGALVWAFSVENLYWQNAGWGLAIDNNDNIYMAANNNATSSVPSDFDPGPGVAILSGVPNGHGVLAKYSNAGNYLWGFTIGEWGQNSAISGVEIVPNDTTLIVTGHIKGINCDVDPGPGIVILNTQQEDIFTGRYSFNGNYVWAFNSGGNGIDDGRYLAIDSAGNFYNAGLFSTTVDLDPGPPVANITSNGNFDAFIVKYDINGNYKWGKSFGSPGSEQCWDITHQSGELTGVGYFSGTVDFDPGAAIFNLSSAGATDAFFTKYDTAGNFLCASRMGGPQDEMIWRISSTVNDTFVVNGSYGSNNIDVDPTAGTLLRTNAGGNDIIFGKYFYQSTPINITATVEDDTVCSGQNPTIAIDFTPNIAGVYTATVSDGVNTYTVNNISDSVSFSFGATPLVLTNYTVTVNGAVAINCDNNTFSVSVPFTVLVNPLPLVSGTASPPSLCAGGSTTLSGAGALSYTWSGGIIDGTPFVPANTTTFTLTGTDANGCTNISTVTVTVNPLPNITANANPAAVCPGIPTTLTGSGGIGYSWSGGVTDGVSFIPSTTATYTVTGIDASGCSNTSAVTVTVNNSIPITIVPADPLLCIGDSVQLTASGATTYVWTNVPGLNTYAGAVVWAQPFVSSTYTVTGTDAIGCTGTSTVTINIISEIDVQASKNHDVECGNNIVQLQASGAQNYTWTPANFLTNPNASITDANIVETTTFYVTGNTGSCTDMDSITVYYYNNDETGMIIPNAFSPNGDGLNDCLRILHNANFTKYYFTIYNRWGEKVFETDDPDACWNGEHKNMPAPMEVYGYFLQAESVCGKIFKKGDITLVR